MRSAIERNPISFAWAELLDQSRVSGKISVQVCENERQLFSRTIATALWAKHINKNNNVNRHLLFSLMPQCYLNILARNVLWLGRRWNGDRAKPLIHVAWCQATKALSTLPLWTAWNNVVQQLKLWVMAWFLVGCVPTSTTQTLQGILRCNMVSEVVMCTGSAQKPWGQNTLKNGIYIQFGWVEHWSTVFFRLKIE